MKTTWKTTMAAAVLSISLMTSVSVLPAGAEGTESQATVITVPSYTLNESLSVEVKGVSVSRTAEGLQLGALIGLTNNGAAITRVPDYELRIKTTEGIEYTLKANSANVKSVMAKENAELTYMVTVDRPGDTDISELSFVEVDEYTYPKTETVVLNVPVSANVWYGTKNQVADPAANIAWGQPFTLPASTSPLRYTPVELTKQSDANGFTYLVTLLAENTGANSENVPAFRLDGKAADKVYTGKRVEQEPVSLAAGEKKYVHFAITADQDVPLQSLLLMTTETFVPGGAQPSQGVPAAGSGAAQPAGFDIGRLSITAPAPAAPSNPGPSYTIGQPISFDPLNQLVSTTTEVSLVELHMHDNAGEGYKSVVAKFKLANKSDMTVATPAFQAQLVGGDGSSYTGTRQTTAAANMMPNLGYVVSYSFMIPASENGNQLTIKLQDTTTAAPYSSTIASFQAAVQQDTEDAVMSFYPFTVKLDDWTIGSYTNPAANGQGQTYSYKLKLWLNVERLEDVVVDPNFSKFKVELSDNLGRVLGSQTVPFTGENKLISGEQTIQFSNVRTEQLDYPLTVKLYESIDTPNGEATRLVKTLTQ
ncbi:hypothetical protein ACFQ88_16965 [Paenibacillus sp. NPDC056579]|uniref:hypothetical protein n=1 Tax=Paenibacillus sp. NPDC056579 TaxID=3345871 RepID=UPI0036CD052D